MRRWWIQWNKVYWSPKQYHFSRCTYPGPLLWITLRRSFIPWRRLTFPVVIQTENNINNLKILLPSISQHLINFFWTICHQNQLSMWLIMWLSSVSNLPNGISNDWVATGHVLCLRGDGEGGYTVVGFQRCVLPCFVSWPLLNDSLLSDISFSHGVLFFS